MGRAGRGDVIAESWAGKIEGIVLCCLTYGYSFKCEPVELLASELSCLSVIIVACSKTFPNVKQAVTWKAP